MGKEEAILFLQKANERIKEARVLLDSGFYPGSVNRSYYAVFNAVQGCLQLKDVMVKTHHGSHIQFGSQFIKTGIFPASIGRIPQQVEETRIKADYESGEMVSKADAEEAIAKAKEFYTAVKDYFDTIK